MRYGQTFRSAFLFLCCLSASAFGQRVTVRVIDSEGKPFTNKQIYISGLSGRAESKPQEQLITRKPIRADLNLMTDSNGEATFDLPEHVPAYLYVRPVFSERVWDCTCFAALRMDELLQKGVVIAPAQRRKTKPSVQPKAGEVLFVMTRTPLWWQLLYPIEKG
jgi:hypothetical protein